MLRVEQNALIQEANLQLLNIREIELGYFSDIWSIIGILNGIIAGYCISAVTQLDAIGADVPDWEKWVLWISSCLCMLTSLHGLLTTTFANVYGTGLGLRGPSGSMVRAVDGMVKENDAIFVSFIITIVLFQFVNMGSVFMVSYVEAGYFCGAIFMGFIYVWYYYCIRIFNRFKIYDIQASWTDKPEGPEILAESKSSISNDEIKISEDNISAASSNQSEDDANRMKLKNKRSSILQVFGFVKKDNGQNAPQSTGSYVPPVMHEQQNNMDGYLTFKEVKKGKIFSAEAWTRQYFVVRGSDMYYYKKKEDYLRNPGKSVKNRPISLIGFRMNTGVTDNGTYEINLQPNEEEDDERKGWSFRCDTVEEMQAWGDCFNKSIAVL